MQINNQGFTLLEVLVALTILSVAFTAIFMSISTNSRNLLYLENKTAANWVALNAIAEIQLGLIDLSEKKVQLMNNEYLLDKNWTWDAHIQATQFANVSRIDVNVAQIVDSKVIIHVVGYLRNEI
jgi:general secretion pathway protein I